MGLENEGETHLSGGVGGGLGMLQFVNGRQKTLNVTLAFIVVLSPLVVHFGCL